MAFDRVDFSGRSFKSEVVQHFPVRLRGNSVLLPLVETFEANEFLVIEC